MRRGPLFALLLLFAGPARAAIDDRTGFGFCASPAPPPCIEDEATYAGSQGTAGCRESVQRYVKAVAAYRTCLAREMERAMLQTNAALERYRCRSQPGSACKDR